jgi:hypothetical protein
MQGKPLLQAEARALKLITIRLATSKNAKMVFGVLEGNSKEENESVCSDWG